MGKGPVQAVSPKLGGSALAEIVQGSEAYLSFTGGLHHRKNLCREATIQLRSRKDKWDVGIHLET